jgi:uncharacterized damage-inducible protein DinB
VTEIRAIRDWYAYNSYVRRRYLDALSKLAPEELSRERGASYPTLIELFKHSLDGVASFVQRMSALHSLSNPQFACPEPPSLDDLTHYTDHLEGQVKRFLATLTEEDLERSFLVPKEPPWWDEDFMAPVRGTLYHLVEEELQHRGELNALLWQIDVEPPVIDWVSWEEAAASDSPKN